MLLCVTQAAHAKREREKTNKKERNRGQRSASVVQQLPEKEFQRTRKK